MCDNHNDPPRTRTWNLRLRRPTPYPLGQQASWRKARRRGQALWSCLCGWLTSLLKCQFARVVKGVDLRSTGRKTAWVRTPQLTSFVLSCADTQRLQIGGRFTEMSFALIAGRRRQDMTVWPSGLRRWLKAPFRKGVGSNPTAVTS